MSFGYEHIVITSNEPWGDTWYSKQNYAWELSRSHKVWFLDPPQAWRPGALFNSGFASKKIHAHLHVLRYTNALPVRNAALYRWNNRIVSSRLRAWLSAQGVRDFLFWSFDPYRLSDPALLGAGASIFHAVDKYGFVPYGEAELARNSDLVLCVAEDFREAYRPYNKHVEMLPHAIAEEEFKADPARVKDELRGRPYGLYVGNVDDRIDYRTLELLLQKFPEQLFVLIGRQLYGKSNARARQLLEEKKYPNLLALGEKPFKELKHYIAAASFCLAPMNRAHPGNTISHHKILQYLALGKPIFSCRFTAYTHLERLLSMHEEDGALIEALKEFLERGEAQGLREARVEFARKHTFTPALEKISGLLSQSKQT